MNILYHIAYGIFYAIALLPFWALYALSDVLFFFFYHIVRYRRKLVDKNLAASFPEMTEAERHKISRKFYRNFTDYLVETIKVLHISDEEMKKRMEFVSLDTENDILMGDRSVAAYFSHCFNWEWATSVTLWMDAEKDKNIYIGKIYRPLKNEGFDRLFLKIRDRFNSYSIPKKATLRRLLEVRREGRIWLVGFMSDQKPSHGDPTYVTTFLNHPTAMITGTETLARRLGAAAIYWDMEKLRRGYYRITCRLLADDVSKTEPMAVTEAYARMLETTIRRDPSIWLWTHNRWKHPVFAPENKT